MCLILFAYGVHPHYPLLVAANRDEFHNRPTAPLAFWDDCPELLAGRDLQAGGTWMGLHRGGRFAALTNYRDPHHIHEPAPSRGHLVRDYLQGHCSADAALTELLPYAGAYNGFNLLLGDSSGLYWYSNRADHFQKLVPGLYGLSNHLLNTPWPKVERGRRALHEVLAQETLTPEALLEALLSVLTDRTPAPDAALPATGVSLPWERWLSPIFIDAPGYGTRSSTVLLADHQGRAHMVEVTWASGNRREFALEWPESMGQRPAPSA